MSSSSLLGLSVLEGRVDCASRDFAEGAMVGPRNSGGGSGDTFDWTGGASGGISAVVVGKLSDG